MVTRKVQRNDPCPCGSGKKYKHCCMRKDQIRRQARQAPPAVDLEQWSEGPIQSQLDQIRTMARATMRHAPPDKAQELQRLLDLAEEVSAYQAMSDEIEAAAQALEAHRAEFEALMGDLAAVADRAHRLFTEERFVPFRFTAADVHRAFEAVGYPQRYREDDQENIKTIEAAILHLADKDYRHRMTRRLMMVLPEYVAAGRYLDAWLIEYCAFQMFEAPGQSNPFLFEMFQYGFIEWGKQVEAEQEALLRELGIEWAEVTGMTVEEVEAWLQPQMIDPARKARLEAYFETHPLLSDQAQAEIGGLEGDLLHLLERDDADALYLSPEEVGPWVPALMDRLEPITVQVQQAAKRGDWEESGVVETVGKIVLDVAQEMVPAVFTPERLERLVADLKDYRRTLLEADEREAAMYANAAVMLLEREEAPADNPLLIGICFTSLRLMMIRLSEEARARLTS